MAGAKETSRQKMIGMMYLVLTALLAMNVSKDILTAFVIINESLYKSNEVFRNNNELMLKEFKLANDRDPEKFGAYYKQSMFVNKIAGDLFNHIEDLKKHLIMKTDDKDLNAADTLAEKMTGVDAKDNYDIPTEIMIGSEPDNPKSASIKWSALELRKRIEEYKDNLLQLVSEKRESGHPLFLQSSAKAIADKIIKSLELRDGIENGVPVKWEVLNFYHLPLAAVITNLSKIQSDINNVQGDVIGELYTEVKKRENSFDRLSARITAPSSYILQGDEYKADVLLVAGNSTLKPKIYLGDVDTTIKDVYKNPLRGNVVELADVTAEGGKYKIKTSYEGIQSWAGVIEVDAEEGKKKYYPFKSEYMVAKPAASVSSDKLNVLYSGIENPITINAAGIPSENLTATIRGTRATIAGQNGKFKVNVGGGTEAYINVSAKINGELRNIGEFKFRVKRVPKPKTQFNGKTGAIAMAKEQIWVAQGIRPFLENFEFEVPYKIVSFDVTVMSNGLTTTEHMKDGNKFSDSQLRLLKSIKKNNVVFIEKVMCKFPDGTTEKIDEVTIKVL